MAEKEAQWEMLGPEGPETQGTFDRPANSMALDLVDAIERDRPPVCTARDGTWTIEMIAGIYQSHFKGAPVSFPLTDRRDPFAV
jgi:predicted dehydrogenase